MSAVEQVLREQLRNAQARADALQGQLDRLQQQITGLQMHEQQIAGKFRKKIAALQAELSLAQKGLTSGCGCPIGTCVRKTGDGSSCWLQWAEAHIMRRMGDIRISELTRHANHPSRHRSESDAQPIEARREAIDGPAEGRAR